MKVRVTKKLSSEPIEIPISTEFIKLQDFMKFANVETCVQRGKKLRPGDTVTFLGNTWKVTQEAL